MENKRGLSAIVATLIIILLVLVAVGIIWVVVRNVIQGGAEEIDISTKCLAVEISAVSVNETSSGVYDVALKRGGDDEEDLGGIKVTIFNATANSGVLDGFTDMSALETITESFDTSGVGSGNKIEFTAYFLDASGEEALCSQTNSYTF